MVYLQYQTTRTPSLANPQLPKTPPGTRSMSPLHHALLHTCMIPHKKTFLRRPIYQGIQFRSPCNIHQTIFYGQYRSQNLPLHASMLHTTLYAPTWSYDYAYEDIFCDILSTAQENIVQDKTITFFTDTRTFALHVIIHFKIRFKHKFESKILPVSLFRVRVRVMVQSATCPQLRKYYYTNKDGGVLYHQCASQLFPQSQIKGSSRYPIDDYSMLDSFEIISNDITFVNSFPLFPPNLSF